MSKRRLEFCEVGSFFMKSHMALMADDLFDTRRCMTFYGVEEFEYMHGEHKLGPLERFMLLLSPYSIQIR